MNKNTLLIFAIIAALGAALIYFLNTASCERAMNRFDGTALDSLGQEIQVPDSKEIDGKIGELTGKPWNFDAYHLIDHSINNNLKNGLVEKKEAESLRNKLDGVYISSLNQAARDFIRTGKGKQQLIYKELSRFYVSNNENKAQVDEAFTAFREYYTLMYAMQKETDEFLQEKFDASRRDELQGALDAQGAKNLLKDSPHVKGFIVEQSRRMDSFRRADYYFESKITSQVNCDTEYAEYEYYRNECKRRQAAIDAPPTPPSDSLVP